MWKTQISSQFTRFSEKPDYYNDLTESNEQISFLLIFCLLQADHFLAQILIYRVRAMGVALAACTLCATKNNSLKLSKSQTESDVSVQLVS
jgi:hypothetical protein